MIRLRAPGGSNDWHTSRRIRQYRNRSGEPAAAVCRCHPGSSTRGKPEQQPRPLTASQSAAQAPESSAAGAARLPVAPRHLPTLETFRAEQPTVKGTSTPTISANAALLIGSLLQSEKLPFEVMAARLSPERYALQQFHGSDLQQMLGRFAEPGHVPGKAETEQLIKGFAQSLADQLEHFQLMHDATAEAFADRNTLAVSQAALGEYAGRASKSIEAGLNHSLAVLDERIATLDSQLEGATEGSRPVLLMDRQALETARAMLSDLHADFCKSPEAKRLNAVAAHTQMDALIDKLNVDRNSVGGWKGFGPIVAAAVPQ
ncbi:type III effector HopM1, partial [Pseudomonas syringae pv. pisi str. 1704B]